MTSLRSEIETVDVSGAGLDMLRLDALYRRYASWLARTLDRRFGDLWGMGLRISFMKPTSVSFPWARPIRSAIHAPCSSGSPSNLAPRSASTIQPGARGGGPH